MKPRTTLLSLLCLSVAWTAARAGDTNKPKKGKSKSAAPASAPASAPKSVIRWGQRAGESDEAYDKRYRAIVKRTRLDDRDDKVGGPVPLYTYRGSPFLIRSDISAEFTADIAMYMEMLHREYGAVYARLLQGVPARIREKIEVVVFKDRGTYLKNGGTAGSGGQFMQSIQWPDRELHWPAQHYRLMQFTDGITEFSAWNKGTLKHEAAHMELQMRLGLFVDSPRWWNEGHACVFEEWNFDLSLDDNLNAVASRGRYAPIVRRLFKSKGWKEFHYVWNIDAESWHGAMTSSDGFVNYALAWSLAAYMMTGGVDARQDFNRIFSLSKRVGAQSERAAYGIKLRAWDEAFDQEQRAEMEQRWNDWIEKQLPRSGRTPDEEYTLKRAGYKPEITDKLTPYSETEMEGLVDWIHKQEETRKKQVFK